MLILWVVGLTERTLLVLVIFLSSLICWSSRNQFSVAQSTTEVEYVAAASCYSQILWNIHTVRDSGVIFERVFLMCDNIGDISVAKKSNLPQKNETP
jgi:hypothetical protein